MPTIRDVFDRETGDEPITMLTAYDAPTARVIDGAGVDVLLVGDSLGTEVLGHGSTLPVTADQMASHTEAVVRGAESAPVVADMPFLTFGVSASETAEHAGRMLKEAGADAVKLESGPHTVETTRHLVELGIPVMAHLGLTPQHVNQLGLQRQGTDDEAARQIIDLAAEHEAAGAFSLVLEHVPANLAARVTETLDIPTIGIGAGPDTDGQVLVFTDVIGLTESPPPFAKAFGDVRSEMERAIEGYRDAVVEGEYPGEAHSYVEDTLDL
jgi:3-methyl-2-oxobutanoate hydroxymethyltransferase